VNPLISLSGSIVLSSAAQIFLKRGVGSPDAQSFARRLLSPFVLLWGLCFAAATLLWIVALSHMDISYAYPMLGSGYVIVTVVAIVFLKERVSLQRWAAVLVIAIGAMMIAGSR